MPKNQKPISQNEPWYLSALKLVLPGPDSGDRPCFPDAPPGRRNRRCLPAPPGQGKRGCWPAKPPR
jgi:hypothetical protein